MTSRDFCYWLQGFFELTGTNKALTKEQCKTIRAHLAMVFAHEIDPSNGTPEHRATLQDLHDNVKVEDTKPPFGNNDFAKRVEELREYFGPFQHSCPHDVKIMC
jgi:hypothetical protein